MLLIMSHMATEGSQRELEADHLLLHHLGRWRVFGLDLPGCGARVREGHRDERERERERGRR
jgi:hypothetical protein